MKQFKVGDWVSIDGCNYYVHEEHNGNGNISKDVVNNLYTYGRDVELWQPKEGEWCWIGKNLSKIVTHDRDGYFTCLNSNGTYTAYMELEYIYKIAEPFIGELPSFLKVVI